MSSLSTHVLDAGTGTPATGMRVEVLAADGVGDWSRIAAGVTDDDGRVPGLVGEGLAHGTYRITFDTGDWFAAQDVTGFYPEVVITFLVDTERHYHVPVLLSPFAYSTYRGS